MTCSARRLDSPLPQESGKSPLLMLLCNLTQALDACYWDVVCHTEPDPHPVRKRGTSFQESHGK